MNITTSKQAEKLAEIGAQFKRIRQDKDLSIPHLTATTLISERYLRAIEDGEIESLPEPVYVRGFIRKYGTALGVGDLSEDFPLNPVLPEQKWVGSAAAELRPLHLYALYVGVIAGAVSLLATFLNPPEANKINDNQTILGNAAQTNPAKLAKPIAAMDVLLPKAGGLEVLRQAGSDPTVKTIPNISKTSAPTPSNENVKENVTATLLNQSQAQTAFTEVGFGFNNALTSWASNISLQNNNSAIAAIPDNTKFEFVGNKPVNVGIVAKGQSWVRITVDGQTEFEGMINEGKKLSWSGDRQISIRAGNASSIALSYNNQPIKVLGKEGEVAERNFGLNQANNVEVNDDGVRGFVEFMSTSNSQ